MALEGAGIWMPPSSPSLCTVYLTGTEPTLCHCPHRCFWTGHPASLHFSFFLRDVQVTQVQKLRAEKPHSILAQLQIGKLSEDVEHHPTHSQKFALCSQRLPRQAVRAQIRAGSSSDVFPLSAHRIGRMLLPYERREQSSFWSTGLSPSRL